ncbi:MAG: cellulase family glycosylhydrolase [Mariprofundaceae bacterium]|nr:cellulase family glycosylhydrolase [Mariprofundaceae bacterium]
MFLSSASAATISTLSTTAISPTSIAVDANGNTYVTDTFNHRVIKIDGNNVTTVVAGTGVAGFLGDGGLATSAQLDMPMGLSLDAAGNIYIADSLNHRIRKVNIVSGNISTVAGNGIVGAAFQGDGGAATLAGLNTPKGVDVDVNNVIWIADTLNNRIRKVDALGVISTAVGTGVAGFGGDNGVPTAALLNRPRDITVSATGKIYIADELNHRIRLVSGGVIQTFAGTGIAGTLGAGGDASLAQLNRPTGIDVDNNGRVYIADSVNHRIVLIDANAILKTIVGTGIAGYAGDLGNAQLAQLSSPRDVAITTNTTLMLADFVNDAVRSISGGDQDWDGTLDVNDAFPDDPAADTDTDGDLAPDGWLPNASLMQIGASLLIRDEFPFDPARSFTVKEVPVGVNLAGAEFTPAAIPGIYGSDYLYPDPVELDYYYSKGFNYVRLPILWERLQPTMLGALATVEIARVDAFMDAAAQRNMKVILDLHNYGKHTGVLSLPAELADFWAKIAARYSNHAAIFAYDLMNEPNATNGSWPSMAQAAVDAIRTVDTTHAVIVAGGNWSTAMNWQQDNLNLVINDASNNIIYEAHQYFDANHSGTYQDINAIKYTQTYQSVHGTRSYSDVVGERLYTFVGWLKKYNHRGYLGEFGVPAGSIVNGTVDTAWLNLLAPLYNYLDKAGVGWTYWASGPWWQGDAMAIDQIANADSLQMRELLKVLDNDKDGVTNNTDVFIYDAAASVDTDADGFPDIWNAAATQAQKTASALVLDGFPNDPIVGLDADVDGSPDAWNSGVTQAQINASNLLLDAFPNNPNRWVDSIIPVISLIGQSVMDVAHGSAFTDPGSSVLDNVDMNLVISAIGAVNTNAVGTYILTYDAADRTGNVAATVTRTVHITDQRAPVITLTGQSITTIAQGSVFVDLGANVVDNVDGSSTITGVSTVNSNIVGNNYTVTYNVSDAAGNAALTVTRTVHVTDQTAPVITFMGQGVMTVAQGSVFTDPGSAVLDNVDTGLVATVTGAVNINLVGIYSLTYNISDAAGNAAATVRIIHVTDQTAPVMSGVPKNITLLGNVTQGGLLRGGADISMFLGGIAASDNVDGTVIVSNGAPNLFANGTTTIVTFRALDLAGNITTVMATVTVNDPNATGSAALAASGTGLTIAQSIAVGLDSNAATTDTDGDGILDIEEIGDPANPYDQDGDGLLDVFEAHASARDASLVSGLKVTAGTVTVSSTGEYIRNINYQASNGQEPARVIFPYGIIGYDTTVPIGTSKTIRLTFSQQLPANLVLYKVGATGAYAQLPRTSWSVASANSINLILTDGDLTTDMDGVANGIIVDPVAVGSALLNQGASTTSGGGGGGGGCSINTSAEFDPLLIVIMLLSMAYLNRRKFILGKN